MDLSSLGQTPISADQPAGVDVRYETEFEELQKEIDKLSIATSEGGGIDWSKVVDLSAGILARKSKHMQVAAYLAAGLIQTQGLAGVSLGAAILRDLVSNFWENMHPPLKRLRGRLSAFSWWLDRAEAFLTGFTPEPLPAEKVSNLVGCLQALDRGLGQKTEEAPPLSRLIELANRLPIQEQAPAPAVAPVSPVVAPTPVSAPAAVPARPAPAPVPPAAAPADIQDPGPLIAQGLERLGRASEILMARNPADPLPYRLTRLAAWLTVDQLPLAENRQTLIPPPDPVIRSAIEQLMTGRDYKAAVAASEARVTQFLFWLDLSRFTAQALAQMGGDAGAAAETVALETALLLKKLPGLENLSFSDGTPFADRETKAWLKTIGLGAAPADETRAARPGVAAEAAEVYSQAGNLLKDKKLAEALNLLETRLTRGPSAQDRLTWRLTLVRLLLDAGRSELAKPHLEELLAQIERFSLEEWDPDLAVSALKLIYLGLDAGTDERDKQKAAEALARLARLSPSQALNFFEG
ncbi:MAG: type VI secretion system protein TssA [Thermodesulfobacteriota bacterium]